MFPKHFNIILHGLLLLSVLLFSGCLNEKEGSLFDPDYVSARPAPEIASISPASGLAGVTSLTITGKNFSAVKTENTVYFNDKQAQIQEASSTQLKVLAPNVVNDSVKVRVGVKGSELFSNTWLYKLEAAVTDFGSISETQEPWAVASDGQGNLYVSMMDAGVGVGIKKFTAAGVRSDYAPSGGIAKWSGMKMGPGGILYTARILRAIYQIPAGGGSPTIWVAFGDLGTVYDLDFDAAGNVWAGGNNDFIYRVRPDRSVKAFPLTANVRSVRVFNNYVYVAGKVFPDSSERVVRFQIISSDSLGPRDDYFNLTASALGGPGRTIYAINFAADGDMYVGTDMPDPMLVVRPNRTVEQFHSGLTSPAIHLLAWGQGTNFYAVRGTAVGGTITKSIKIFRVNALKNGAPYLGAK
ncbi:MAG: hypothetical protein FJ215_00875 [Ignavibacteria bacterium]|nr:hypothetical protein [Ignavibacteria bacterium]